MNSCKVARYIFVYLVVVCPLERVLSHGFAKSAGGEAEHIHSHVPCDTCPRQGQCVPRVRCPAHVRPGSINRECHLESGLLGICCYTGTKHAAEFERQPQQRAAVPVEAIKSAHSFSHALVDKMYHTAVKLLDQARNTTVAEGTPDFGLHLSLRSDDQQASTLGRGGMLNLLATQELKTRQAISDLDLMLDFTQHTDGPYCPPLPSCPDPPGRYRTVAGECNNVQYPTWGAANTGYERLLPPDYSDGTWAFRVSITGLPLPSARAVSAAMLPDGYFPSPIHNMLFMQTSQFVAHDISAAVIYSTGNSSISCCSPEGLPLPPEQLHFACAPIDVDTADEFYGHFGKICLSSVRSQLAPSIDCTAGYAKPMNGATHFLDLSHFYGKNAEKMSSMRSGGMVKTFNDYGRDLPPLTHTKDCMSTKEHGACFESGDSHGNQVISLTALHTIFTREHNRLAHALSRLNALWDDDTVFFESRRILQAMYQHIVYGEWLPMILGPHIMKAFNLYPSPGYSNSYDPHTNPAIVTEFAAAAMRFGHSIVSHQLKIPYLKRGSLLYEAVSLPEVMFDPSRLRLRPFFDRLLAGLAAQPMQSVDPFLTEALTRYMFHGGKPHGLDLASLNIQRGRDFGVRSYNQYRRLIGLQPYTDFDQFPPSASKRLSSVYSSPEDIDLYIGGLLEVPVEGGIVGPTFANIIAEQFSRLKRGDRYFYENGPDVNPSAFTPSQLAEIKKITLSRIICDNRDGIELTSMPPQAFLRSDLPENVPVPCDSTVIPSIDLTRFRVL